MASEHVIAVSEKDFEEKVISSSDLVIADFWAEWCAPCLRVAPVLEEMAQEYGGKVKIAKINVDKDPGLAAKYGIRSIPTLLFFQGGKVADSVIGMVPKKDLTQKVANLIG